MTALSVEATDTLFGQARTTREFAPDQVSDDDLVAAYELARLAPTASNAQPMRVVFVRGGEARAALLESVAPHNRPKVESAPCTAVVAWDTRFHEFLPRLYPIDPTLPAALEDDAPLRREVGTFNATLQAAYLMIALRARGLSVGPMGGFDRPRVDDLLLAGTGWESLLLVNIGRPSGPPRHDRLPRLDPVEALRLL